MTRNTNTLTEGSDLLCSAMGLNLCSRSSENRGVEVPLCSEMPTTRNKYMAVIYGEIKTTQKRTHKSCTYANLTEELRFLSLALALASIFLQAAVALGIQVFQENTAL